MTILQASAFTGLSHEDARPGSYTKTTTIETIIKDSAVVYETLTGYEVPGAAGISATPHVHDGTDGALIRLPLAQHSVRGMLYRRTSELSSGGTRYEGYYPFAWFPFYAPPGVSSVKVMLFLLGLGGADSFQAEIYDDSANLISVGNESNQWTSDGGEYAYLQPNVGSYATVGWDLTVTADAVNVLKLEAWDGRYDQTHSTASLTYSELPDVRAVRGWCVVPLARAPTLVVPRQTSPVTSTTTHKLDPTPQYHGVDSGMVADDRPVSSYLVVNEHRNQNLMYEVLTGLPAANRPSASVSCHNHQDEGDSAALETSGADLHHSLGAWSYGCAQPPYGLSPGGTIYPYNDYPKGDGTFEPSDWSIQTMPIIDEVGASGATYYTVAEHYVRIPSLKTITTLGGLKAAAHVLVTAVGMTVRVTIGDSSGTYGTSATATPGGTGRSVITITGLDAPSRDTLCRVKVEISTPSVKGSYGDVKGLYGLCLYYEA